ncbi:T9SS type A sorting domain-containing protein [Hymenobacter sp. YC55]|uniref:T9SS type A sorting domain-containing protein n=1 Tax=Hymenobacter sp. YC55 TaxID=3034019 RepID=UPI0023F703F7|nr:T9SS type A sorting domain-containing protein [Hymenobacter sp. YC55]MDF7811135.1 T9SS type A sorting domain-containing protein [Hymenobacter sp. YC55]
MRKTLTLLSCLFSLTAYAQRETQNWFFGNRGGLTFQGATPVATGAGQLNSYEACATISDANGGLLFYTNSVGVWNRNHSSMLGSSTLSGHTSTTQGALIVPVPGSNSLYYLFSVDACDNLLVGGLNYSLVDMQLQNGLGGIIQPFNRTVATPSASGKLTEKLTAIRHANGRDTWVMVHEWLGNGFFAFLVSSTGISNTPVVSRVGSIHQGGGGDYGNANAVGYMKASTDGSLLGVAVRDAGLELFDFNNATGQVTNARRLYTGDTYARTYGVAFSPDNTKLYTTDLSSGVYQYNLASPNPASTRQNIGYSSYPTSALLLGPDGRIYVSQHQSSSIGAIANPNALGSGANYSSSYLSVGGICQVGLPNFPNAFATQPLSTASRKLAEQVTVYPNPAQDVVWVRLPKNLSKQSSEVTLFDALGQQVFQQMVQVSKGEEGTAVKLTTIPKGLYTLQISTESGLLSKKLVIE